MSESNPIIEYKAEIENLPSKKVHDLRIYLRNAARLGSMGDASLFYSWQERTTEDTKLLIEKDIALRSRIGMWELENLEGIDLAHSIIESQDMRCLMFLDAESKTKSFFKNNYTNIDAWSESAEEAEGLLSNESANFLTDFINTFPIKKEHMLSIVEFPMGTTEQLFIQSFCNIEEAIDLQKRKIEQDEQEAPDEATPDRHGSLLLFDKPSMSTEDTFHFALAADDDGVSEEFMTRFGIRNQIKEVSLDYGQTWSINAHIDSNWNIKVVVKKRCDKQPSWTDRIIRMNIGPLALNDEYFEYEDGIYEEIWTVSLLKSLPKNLRNEIIEDNINGLRNRICFVCSNGKRYAL
jgi:hypothetical protein